MTDQILARSGIEASGRNAFPHDAALITEKVDGILASPAFLRAPILSRLLRFLLDRTLTGEADTLKAYTVAVEGLDRSPDFDAQFDSYPRVQMVRLRKALEAYYADNPTVPEPWVHLGAGSYRLQLAPRDTAYPNSSRLPRMNVGALPGLAAIPVAIGQRMPRRRTVAILAILVVGLAGLSLFLFHELKTARTPALASTAVRAPVIEIGFRDAVNASRSNDVIDTLSEALTRSWVTQVRDSHSRNGPDDQATPSPTYRIVMHEADGRIDGQLIDARSDMVLWTGTADGEGAGDLRTRLTPMIAKLVGPFGVIARTETSRLTSASKGSFACILRYFAFMKTRGEDQRAQAAACLEDPVDEPQLKSTVAAIRSFFALESGAAADWRERLAQAEHFARKSTDADAEDPYAHFAKARLAYLRSDCAAGLFYGDRAVAANPYDSMIVTLLAGLTTPCSSTRAGELLDQAYRIRNDNDVTMRSALIFATIAQGQEKRLGELGFLLRPPAGPRLPGYLLTESILTAFRGKTTEAKGLWSEFQALRPDATSDDERLKTIILSNWMRERVLKSLRARGVTGS